MQRVEVQSKCLGGRAQVTAVLSSSNDACWNRAQERLGDTGQMNYFNRGKRSRGGTCFIIDQALCDMQGGRVMES